MTPARTRALRYVDRVRVQPLAEELVFVETPDRPSDVAELAAARPGPLAATAPDGGGERTVIAVRDRGGALRATVTVARAEVGPLAGAFPAATLARTAYLSELAWADGDAGARVASLALYLAARRARILGASALALHAGERLGAIDHALRVSRLDAAPPWRGAGAFGQRVDLAAARASDAWLEAGGDALEPAVFGDEVAETFERWVVALYRRGFFAAVSERRLGRAQFVYAISNMHQFVRWTTRLLGHAIAHSHDGALRDGYIRHLQGEINHEQIIERDLVHLGEDVPFVTRRMAASPGTRHFMAVQESVVGFHHDPVHLLASPLAAEGVASHLTPEFLAALEATIASWGVPDPRRAMMFFSSHVTTDGGDDGHWEGVLSEIRRHLRSEDAARTFLGFLRASMAALGAAYDEYVTDVGIFAPA